MIIKSFNHILWVFCIGMLFASCGRNASEIESPLDLMVGEGFKDPVGYYDDNPTLSWKLPVKEDIKSQSSYRIVAARNPKLLPDKSDLWDTGKVTSDQSAWIKYSGTPLESRHKVYWQVMFWDQDGRASGWSNIATFELGLLDNEDWKARWIGLPVVVEEDTIEGGFHFYRPQYLRNNFTLSDKISEARLYITAKGVFEAQINGEKIGSDVMTPGWTPYKKRIETLTYDVTDNLKPGENAIGVILAQGWHSGRIGYERSFKGPKPLPQVICQLEITYKSGKKQFVCSDASWKGTRKGPLRFSGIYDGEEYDANLEMPGWSTSGFNDANWQPVKGDGIEQFVRLLPKRHHAVTDKKEMPVVAITTPEQGRYVFDLGQNMVGVAKLNIPVKMGQKVRVRFAEMLQEDGNLYTANYRTARSTDYYIPKEDGKISWQPKFTFHGFRYVELSGFDAGAVPDKSWVRGIVQYSDFEEAGNFNSSHRKLNKLQSNIKWGLKSNFFDIPTDCPQRDERMGWTGDAQVFAPTSMLNCDVYAFWASWLQSVREEQFKDGGIPLVVPNNRSYGPSSGWSDAATVIPWELYFRTGDKHVLEENYGMMKRLVEYYRLKPENRSVELNTLGDWLQPYPQNKEDDKKGDTPEELIETAYFAHSVNLTLKAARVLGYNEDITELSTLRDSLKVAFNDKFLDDSGKLKTTVETQTGYLMALGFDLVQEEMAQKIVPHLVRKIEDADNHLRTGFLGTPLLAPVLSKYGQTALMYKILFQETYPSWFYSINQGATTMWERWNSYSHKDGFGEVSMNSFNHYAYGAIGQWMYETIGGIRALEPGYKKILIVPQPGNLLKYAEAVYNSIYGKIFSGWEKLNNGMELKVTIPPNTTAKVIIPVEEGMSILRDGEIITDSKDVKIAERNIDSIILEVVSGSYIFSTKKQLVK